MYALISVLRSIYGPLTKLPNSPTVPEFIKAIHKYHRHGGKAEGYSDSLRYFAHDRYSKNTKYTQNTERTRRSETNMQRQVHTNKQQQIVRGNNTHARPQYKTHAHATTRPPQIQCAQRRRRGTAGAMGDAAATAAAAASCHLHHRPGCLPLQ